MTKQGCARRTIGWRSSRDVPTPSVRFASKLFFGTGLHEGECLPRACRPSLVLGCALLLASCEPPSEIGGAVAGALSRDGDAAPISLKAIGGLDDVELICLIPESMTPAEVLPAQWQIEFSASLRPVSNLRTGLETTSILYVSPATSKLIDIDWGEFGLVSNPRDAACHSAEIAALVPRRDSQTASTYFEFSAFRRK